MAAALVAAVPLLLTGHPDAADTKGGSPPAEGVPADAKLHVRYAEARLQLGRLKLEQAEKLNAATPGLLSETDMRRLRQRVAVLEAQVGATRDQPHGNALEAQRAEAKAMARIAAEDLSAAVAVHRRVPGALSDNKLRQFEARAEIARLRAELWDDPSFRRSPIDVMQMQIDQLADLVIEAAEAVEAAPAMNRR